MALKGKMTPKTHSTPFKNFNLVPNKAYFRVKMVILELSKLFLGSYMIQFCMKIAPGSVYVSSFNT